MNLQIILSVVSIYLIFVLLCSGYLYNSKLELRFWTGSTPARIGDLLRRASLPIVSVEKMT